ncbi:MAG: hypothetical protein ACOH2H_24100 [Cypionkella sp.]
MSIPWFTSSSLPQPAAPRGAAPVGIIAELPALEQGAVLLMRQWCEGEAGRIAVAEDFIRTLGEDRGTSAVNCLAHLISLLVSHGRRPFMRHDVRCACFGGDESAFAQMVAGASAGDRDDAMAFALTLMPPAIAYEAVQTAEPLGLLIHAMARQLRGTPLPGSRMTPAPRRH